MRFLYFLKCNVTLTLLEGSSQICSTDKLHIIREETFLRLLVDLEVRLLGMSAFCMCACVWSWQHYTRFNVTVFFNICPLEE